MPACTRSSSSIIRLSGASTDWKNSAKDFGKSTPLFFLKKYSYKFLIVREELASVLERHHVDLVLHGHVHRPFVGLIGGPGSAVVIEPGSGTYAPPPSPKSRPLARYNIYTFTSEQQHPPASSVPSSLHQKNSTWSLSNAISRRLVISSVRSGFTFDNDTLVLPR